MPRGSGQNIEPDVFTIWESKEVKKVGETTTTEVWKPATGKRFLLVGFVLSGLGTAESEVILEDETTKFFTLVQQKAPAPPVVVNFTPCYQSLKLNNKLKLAVVATCKITATFYGTEE